MKLAIEILESTFDKFGNRYYALRATAQNKTIQGIISGGESNIRAIDRYWDKRTRKQVTFNLGREIPQKEFFRLTKKWEYLGCTPDELAKAIKARIEKAF